MDQSEGNTAAGGRDGGPLSPQAEALRAAIGESAAAVRRFLFGMCGRWDQAEDLAQEALLKAWQGRDRFGGRADPRTWIFAIARNHWLDSLRRGKGVRNLFQMAFLMETNKKKVPDPFSSMARQEVAAAVEQALAKLPVEMREALALRESDGLSFPQIAETLDIPLATAKTRVRRALLRLADDLAPLRPEVDS